MDHHQLHERHASTIIRYVKLVYSEKCISIYQHIEDQGLVDWCIYISNTV